MPVILAASDWFATPARRRSRLAGSETPWNLVPDSDTIRALLPRGRMSTKITSFILVGMNSTAAAVAGEAASRYFPGAAVKVEPSLEAARAGPEAPGPELLLLGPLAAGAAAQAAAIDDARGLARWPVVVFGPGAEPGAWSLPSDDWNAAAAARIFDAAVFAHALVRENARLRGDLFTISRRLSHDLRTPLMGISSACDAIRETTPDDGSSREALAQSIVLASEDIGRLIERLSAVLKASAEAKPKEPVAMGEIVWASLQRLQRRIRETGATVAQPPSWPAVTGVASWLEVVWWNLGANALEHAGAAPRVEFGWRKDEPAGYRFWTDDQGPGVAAHALAGLFQPFDLLHRPNSPRGWGLPLVQRLVELQGGRCGYEPRSGGGARFFFTLPA